MAWETLDDGTGYFLIPFDADGKEVVDDGEASSDAAVQEVRDGDVTDVVVMSHGWNGDVPAARDQYTRWLTAMSACQTGRDGVVAKAPDFTPLVIGLHWPSKAWGDETLGGDGSFSLGGESPTSELEQAGVEQLVADYAALLRDSETCRAALRTIFEAALDDIAPPVLPAEVARAYASIDAEIALGAGGDGAAPGSDRDSFDAELAYDVAMEEDLTSFGGASLGGILAPLRTLTFWQMKRRACLFGESGAGYLLARLQSAVRAGRHVRFHLVGHSFGCIVVSASVAGQSAQDERRVDSLVLIQGALSLWSYCPSIPSSPMRAGYFNRIVANGLVGGPTVATMSEHDKAVGLFYPLGARAARQLVYDLGGFPRYGGVGAFGVRGLPTVEDHELRAVDDPYAFARGGIYNLESSSVIKDGHGASGAHSDICHPEVAYAVWSAMAASISGG